MTASPRFKVDSDMFLEWYVADLLSALFQITFRSECIEYYRNETMTAMVDDLLHGQVHIGILRYLMSCMLF